MYYPGSFKLRYTTNSGLVWFTHPDFSYNYNSLFFVNKDTGWATTTSYTNYIYMTTNGGANWIGKYNGLNEVYYDIYFANSQKGWVSGLINKVCITTNGGNNWGTQNLISFYTSKMFFLDSLNGWIETTSSTIAHTTNGGGPITRIVNNTNSIISDYKLYQNYPNPFNPSTTIKYSLISKSYVELKIFDISGKEIINVVSKEQNKGTYEKLIDFTNITSGIYFYRLSIKDNNRLNTVFSETKRMVFLK
ncbi:MAG: T9SS type A sorting domain-containing protein [Ignavibacteria bacterium]|nr:T9SS type A sorting domain-containing protein [Ignavibacteria bacterium]